MISDAHLQSCNQRFLKSWIEETDALFDIPGFEIPSGIALDEDSPSLSPIFLTKDFFEKTEILIPQNPKPVVMKAYKYYLISKTIGIKGSGTNPPTATNRQTSVM